MPRSGPFSRRRPGRRREPEPADDGRSPGPSQRRRRDRLRHRRDEAGSDQTSGEGPPPGHPSSEEGAEPLPERADAEHSCPRRGRPAVRPGLPTRRERLQGYLGRQEAGDRTAEHPSRETRGRRGRRDGRFPELRTGVSERAQVSDDRERSDLSWCARRRREVPRAVSDDAGIVDPPLDGLPWPSAWCRRQAGRGRARRDEHGGRRGLRGGALDDRHVGRRILPDGRGDRAGRDDGDPVGRDPRAAQRSVDRIANEDGARGPEPRPWRRPGRLAGRDRMHEKRMRKLDGLRKDTPPPELWGPEDADLTLIHWGSTWGAAHEAIQNVEGRGIRVNSLEFPTLFPFHTDATLALLKDVKQSLAIEGNYTGQFTRLRSEEHTSELQSRSDL